MSCYFTIEASKEPMLASFMHASILSHSSLEQALAFQMANLLASPAMLSTQMQALFLEQLEKDVNFQTSVRLDILAVITRDPAVDSFTDVLLYMKGFHALETHRVAHQLWMEGRTTLGKLIPLRFQNIRIIIIRFKISSTVYK